MVIHVGDDREANRGAIGLTLKRRLLDILQVLLCIKNVVVLIHHHGLIPARGFVRRHLDGVADAVVQGEPRLHAPAIGPKEAVSGQDAVGQDRG